MGDSIGAGQGKEGREADHRLQRHLRHSDLSEDIHVASSAGGGTDQVSSTSTPSSSSSSSSSGSSSSLPTPSLVLECMSPTQLARHRDEEAATRAFLEEEQRARQRELDARRYTCMLCLDNDVDLNAMLSLSCDHKFCCECFSRFCESKIGENAVGEDSFVCPFGSVATKDKCTQPVTIHEIKNNVTQELFDKYERFCLKTFAERHSDTMRFCPKCNEWFAEIPQGDADENVWKAVQCGGAGCRHQFCGKCGEAPHKGQKDQNFSCAEFAAWKQQNEEGDKGFAALMASTVGPCSLPFLPLPPFLSFPFLSSYLTLHLPHPRTPALVPQDYAQCPKCSQMGERQGKQNCKFTYCRCGQKYCFLCGVTLEEVNHYTHFQGTSANGTKCTGPFGNGCRGIDDPQIVCKRVVSEIMKARSGSGPASSSSSSSSAAVAAAVVPAGANQLAVQVAAAAAAAGAAAGAAAIAAAMLRPAKKPKKPKAPKAPKNPAKKRVKLRQPG